jgi:iron-sulfur cluster repair protein YtfE (RIC family)
MIGHDHPPLQRHHSLQPFSRDHFVGLRAANRLRLAAQAGDSARLAAATYLYECWDAEICDHFQQEENLLIPLMLPEETQRLRREHDTIRDLVATGRSRRSDAPPAVQWCAELGRHLHDHIRWEERVLFGSIQQRATPVQLAAVGRATAEIEKRRPGLRIRGPRQRMPEPQKKEPI